MSIKIACVGKLKEEHFKDGVAEYAEGMGRFVKVRTTQVPDEKTPEKLSPAGMEQVKEIGGKRALDKIKDKEYVCVTAIKGEERISEDLAKELADLATYGRSDITFVIGGSLGTNSAVNKRADDLISFGKFTIPHQLTRLALVE